MTLRPIRPVLGALLLACLAGTAFAQDSAASPQDAGRSTASDNHDAVFMRTAAAAKLAEIQAGRIALDRGSSTQVRQMAQRIIDDHTKAHAQLTDIARRRQVTLPSAPMPMQKQEADRLAGLSGTAFDQAYASAMVKDHRDAIKLFGMESQNGADADLRQFAGATLPALKQHMQMAGQAAAGDPMRDHPTDPAGGDTH